MIMFKGILAAYRDLEKIERVGLWAAVFPMSLFLIFISVYERPPYILCSGLIDPDTPISDNTVRYWSDYERETNLQTIPTTI